MANRSRDNSMNFMALQMLHRGEACHYQQKKQLKRLGFIRADCSLTVKGKMLIYSDMLGIPILSFKILAILYCHKCMQSASNHMPASQDLFLFLFTKKSSNYMSMCMTSLKKLNLAEKCSCRYIRITDSAFEILKKHDADIVEIESTF